MAGGARGARAGPGRPCSTAGSARPAQHRGQRPARCGPAGQRCSVRQSPARFGPAGQRCSVRQSPARFGPAVPGPVRPRRTALLGARRRRSHGSPPGGGGGQRERPVPPGGGEAAGAFRPPHPGRAAGLPAPAPVPPQLRSPALCTGTAQSPGNRRESLAFPRPREAPTGHGQPWHRDSRSSLSPAGGWAVTGPRQVTVEQGSSLALSCSYKPRYKLSFKYWSRKSSLMTSMIQTDGSEVTVTRDRVSIRDNHTANSFTVTLSSVTAGDAGWYSCGVKKVGIGRGHSTEVMVSAGKTGLEAKLPLNSPLAPLPPVQSQPSVIHLLLLLSIKVPVALAVIGGAAWVRSRGRSREQEMLQLLGASSSTRTRGCPPVPNPSEPQGRPPAPPAPTLPGPCLPSRPPRAGSCSAPGAAGPGKPRPLLAAPALHREGFGLQRASGC
ncbi:uncharacterized protein LOC141731256 [Zonotrichia albicollis]|uniref:uncharacterized protein LOC141731256 n=1 Tax=Zonotrichia albicollis TaxID=44394 RepID=UPI003D80F875